MVWLSHSCPLLNQFEGFRCHLADTLVRSNDMLSLTPGEWEIWDGGCWTYSQQCTMEQKTVPNYQSYAATWWIQTKSWLGSNSTISKLLKSLLIDCPWTYSETNRQQSTMEQNHPVMSKQTDNRAQWSRIMHWCQNKRTTEHNGAESRSDVKTNRQQSTMEQNHAVMSKPMDNSAQWSRITQWCQNKQTTVHNGGESPSDVKTNRQQSTMEQNHAEMSKQTDNSAQWSRIT